MKKLLVSIFSIFLCMSIGQAAEYTSAELGQTNNNQTGQTDNANNTENSTTEPLAGTETLDSNQSGKQTNNSNGNTSDGFVSKSGQNGTENTDTGGQPNTNSSKLTEDQSSSKISELRDNAQNMKDKEQSLANRTLGAASIGATGIGASQLMSGRAEQRADEQAENQMKALLATFSCDYGQGRNITGGTEEVILPGGNTLMPLYTEYKTLATELKNTKEALGMTPGIESEVIFDKAETGLYDNASLGRQSGAFTSVSRALSDPTGADADAWAQQKADAADKTKTGAIVAGTGIAAGIVGNLALNSGKGAQEKSAHINNKYKNLADAAVKLEKEVKEIPVDTKCLTGATGTFPNCICADATEIFNANDNTCAQCTGGRISVNNECQCPAGKPVWVNGTCTAITPSCNLTGPVVRNADGTCMCAINYTQKGNACVCKPPHESDDAGNCLLPASAIPDIPDSIDIKLTADTLFYLGKEELGPDALRAIDTFVEEFNREVKNYSAYCIDVIGHADRTGKTAYNQTLSERRAASVGKALTDRGLTNINASGLGEIKCKPSTPRTQNENCRKVEIRVDFSSSVCNSHKKT